MLIDARSPVEFAEDHLPGAVNLPVLSDAERAEVGTIYVQDDPLQGAARGRAYVARNVARHLETALADSRRVQAAGLLLARRDALGGHGHDPEPGGLAHTAC
jgi:tRNA 2-selenouridine synthase SelU